MKPKHPKRIFKRKAKWVDPMVSLSTMQFALGAIQVKQIIDTPSTKYAGRYSILQKKRMILNLILETASKMTENLKGQKQRRFNATGRYIK
jgi:hypothetical protein